MADYAGAVAAIQQRLRDNWSTTEIAFQNETPPDPWPPVDGNGNPAPWVDLEVIQTTGKPYATGTPGAQIWLHIGLIYAHVFVPVNSGSLIARQYAWSIGEIFRNQIFYNDTPPTRVRTITPSIDGGDSSADNAGWWRVTTTIDFEFFYSG